MKQTIYVKADVQKSEITYGLDISINADNTESAIQEGAREVSKILLGEIIDPTLKRCSRCIKLGRMPYHAIEEFSTLKNGKRLSQCKTCRTEQAVEWEQRAKHRKAYHKEYQKTYIPTPALPQCILNTMEAEELPLDVVFIAQLD